MSQNLLRITACLLLLCLPASLDATATAQGTVQSQGNVRVNGSVVRDTSSLFVGDRVQTGADGLATVTSEGVMVQMDPNTSAIFANRMVSVGCGGVLVTTTIGTFVQIGKVSVTPAAAGTTKVQVSHGNGVLKITAHDNWAVVHDGTTSTTLAPKQTLTLDRPGASCEPLAAVPQAGTRLYIPATALSLGLGPVAYCASHWFCSESSPSAP